MGSDNGEDQPRKGAVEPAGDEVFAHAHVDDVDVASDWRTVTKGDDPLATAVREGDPQVGVATRVQALAHRTGEVAIRGIDHRHAGGGRRSRRWDLGASGEVVARCVAVDGCERKARGEGDEAGHRAKLGDLAGSALDRARQRFDRARQSARRRP
jgi:hypothetical protein